jgi:cell division protein FtsW
MAPKPASQAPGSPDWILLAATTALIALGLMMVYSASVDLGFRGYGDGTYFLKRQLAFLGVGAVSMFIASQVHYRHLTKVSVLTMFAALVMLVILVVNGAGRQLLDKSGSPAEFAKLALVIYIGHWLASKRVEQLRRLPVGPLPFTIIVGLVAGLVMLQPDFSEAIVIVLVSVVMFFVAGADLLQFVVGVVGGTAAFVLVVRQVQEVQLRIEPWLIAWKDPVASADTKLYQLREGLIALGSGGVFGAGPGNGRASYRWLPVAHTDSIFAIVGEELGLVGCLVIIGLFGVVIYRGLQIARRAPDPFGSLLAAGITSMLALQMLVNVAVLTGLLPPSGIALPFISYGGSSLLTCMVGVGIMLSISRAPAVQ